MGAEHSRAGLSDAVSRRGSGRGPGAVAGVEADVVVVGTPGAPGSVVGVLLDAVPGVAVDDGLADEPERLVGIADGQPATRFVHVVRHPFAAISESPAEQRDAEAAWTTANGNLADAAERIGCDRVLVLRAEEIATDPARVVAALAAFVRATLDAPPVTAGGAFDASPRPPRIGRATRALAIELGYAAETMEAGPSGPVAPTPSPHGAPIRRLARGDRVPASPAQQRLLFIEAFHPGLAVYNLPSVKRVIGPLDVDAMTTALNTVVRRHEPLRTNFELFDGEWAQVVVPPTPVSLPVDDLRDVPADRRDEVAAAAVAAEVRRPFDLRSDLKLRARLLRTDDEIHVLVATVHHIAADGSSMVTMSTEVAACYEAAVLGTEPQVAPLPVRYTDVSVWQSEQLATGELATQLDRWRQRLAGRLPVLELPTDRPRPPTFASEAGSVDVELTGALATEVRGPRAGPVSRPSCSSWAATPRRSPGGPGPTIS